MLYFFSVFTRVLGAQIVLAARATPRVKLITNTTTTVTSTSEQSLFERLKIGLIISKFREALGAVHARIYTTAMSSRESIDALQAAAARRAARPAWHSPAPAEAEPIGDAEPIAAPAEPSAETSPPAEAEPAELSEAPEPAGAEPRAESPATAEVEPRAETEAEPSAETPPPADAGPRVEAPAPEAEPCAEAKFDWHAKPGPAKFAAFMEALPAGKYGGPAYVPAYPIKTK